MRRAMGRLTAADRQAVADFMLLLAGELGYNRRTNEYVDPAVAADDPDVYVATPPGDPDTPRVDP